MLFVVGGWSVCAHIAHVVLLFSVVDFMFDVCVVNICVFDLNFFQNVCSVQHSYRLPLLWFHLDPITQLMIFFFFWFLFNFISRMHFVRYSRWKLETMETNKTFMEVMTKWIVKRMSTFGYHLIDLTKFYSNIQIRRKFNEIVIELCFHFFVFSIENFNNMIFCCSFFSPKCL